MVGYSLEKIISVVLSYKNLHKMSLYTTSQVGKDVKVVSSKCDSCFSQDSYWSPGPVITLGTDFYASAFYDAPKMVPVTEVKSTYRTVASRYYGAYYHEMFHLLYTSFGAIRDLVNRCDYPFQQFAHNVSNILEDITIEASGKYYYPKSIPFLEDLAQVFFQEKMIENLKDAIETEPEAPATLLSYLLSYVRGVDLSTLPKYQLWEDHKKFLEWGAYKCINTIEAKSRAKRQVAYALQLLKILNHENPDENSVENGDPGDVDKESSGKLSDGGTVGKASSIVRTVQKISNDMNRGSRIETEPQDACTPEQQEEEMQSIQKELQAKHETGSNNGESGLNLSPDLTTQGITMLASDEPVLGLGHWAADLKQYADLTTNLPEYNKVVSEHMTEINQVVNQIKKMKALNNASWNHYQMSGKLDMSTIYKKGNYKVFKKKNAPKEEADLVFEILVDNSGSMRGNKARLAGQALIIFCEALHRLHIPFSVDCFTEGDQAITISLKHYHDIYDRVKTNMTLMTKEVNVDKLSTWCGNVDEVNLQYVSQELMEQRQKDKVLLVISDGATCGSVSALKKLAEHIEAKGVTVLGIGIYDHNVESIYSKHMVVSNSQDLEQLGNFLNKYLVKLIFKGGR